MVTIADNSFLLSGVQFEYFENFQSYGSKMLPRVVLWDWLTGLLCCLTYPALTNPKTDQLDAEKIRELKELETT